MTVTPLSVDGARPAVQHLAPLFARHDFTDGERQVLMVLALDSYDGESSAPGYDNLAAWTGLLRSSVIRVLDRLHRPFGDRPAVLERRSAGGRRVTRWRFLFVPQPTAHGGQFSVPEPTAEGGQLTPVQPTAEPTAEPTADLTAQGGRSLPFPAPPPVGPPEAVCPKHRGIADPPPCRRCGEARKDRDAYDRAERDRRATAQPFSVQPGQWCQPGTHRLVADGSCIRCDRHASDIAAEAARGPWPIRDEVTTDALR